MRDESKLRGNTTYRNYHYVKWSYKRRGLQWT